ncbi:MAG: molecular chaperone GrpE [Planctomycetota bacterium]|jgi:molecular chaperone GrpE
MMRKRKKNENKDTVTEESKVNSEAEAEETTETIESQEAEALECEIMEKDPESELAELRDRLQRTTAEFMNFRKQTEKRQKDSRVFVRRDVFEQILPIVDNFGAAMKALDQGQDATNVLIGVKMIQEMLEKLLVDNGIKHILAKDLTFNPNLHEAVSREARDEVAPNVVLAEIAKGYTMGDLVLRHARVIVSAEAEVEVEAGVDIEEPSTDESDEDQIS